jgi:hydrogenase nickel incorporation protein HypB
MHRVKVRVVEDTLDADNTIAQAYRADFDRAAVAVVKLMSAQGAGKTTLLDAVLGPGIDGVRAGVLEGDVPRPGPSRRARHRHERLHGRRNRRAPRLAGGGPRAR